MRTKRGVTLIEFMMALIAMMMIALVVGQFMYIYSSFLKEISIKKTRSLKPASPSRT